MITYAFSVYDKKVGAFMPPFFVRSRGEAIRSFGDACNGAQAPFGRHGEDFALFQLGHFDDATGLFTSAKSEPTPIVSALEMQQEVPPVEAGVPFERAIPPGTTNGVGGV